MGKKFISVKKSHGKTSTITYQKTYKIKIQEKKSSSKSIKPKLHNNKLKLIKPKKQKPINKFFKIKNNKNPSKFNWPINSSLVNKIPPWMNGYTKNIVNSKERFNKEIIDYVSYITPHDFSLTKRKYTIEQLTHIIETNYPNFKVSLYGSFCQNISTLFSDLDFSIHNINGENCSSFLLLHMVTTLKKEGFSKDIEFINANVPILRGTCKSTGIEVDISYNSQHGETAERIRNIVDNNEFIKLTVIFMKILLKVNNLNETYFGGMSSFLLFHLIYYYNIIFGRKNAKDEKKCDNISYTESSKELNNTISENETCLSSCGSNDWLKWELEKEPEKETEIGDYILSFLHFYGYEFDSLHLGLSINNDIPLMFTKFDNYGEQTISIESIEFSGRDIGTKCYNYFKIVNLFQKTYMKIKQEMANDSLSILQEINFPTCDD